jgi:transcription elongation factor Elf1
LAKQLNKCPNCGGSLIGKPLGCGVCGWNETMPNTDKDQKPTDAEVYNKVLDCLINALIKMDGAEEPTEGSEGELCVVVDGHSFSVEIYDHGVV